MNYALIELICQHIFKHDYLNSNSSNQFSLLFKLQTIHNTTQHIQEPFQHLNQNLDIKLSKCNISTHSKDIDSNNFHQITQLQEKFRSCNYITLTSRSSSLWYYWNLNLASFTLLDEWIPKRAPTPKDIEMT